MQQAGLAATTLATTRPGKGGRRLLALLPLAGLAAIAGLIVSHGNQPGARSRLAANRLEMQEKTGHPAPPAVIAARRERPPLKVIAILGDATLEPVGRAIAPGGAPDGSLRIAARLIDGPRGSAARVDLATTPSAESPGNTALAARAAGTEPPLVQVAALAPPVRAPLPPPWQRYAQKFDPLDKRPRIALVIAGADDNMDVAIDTLPAPVTLAFDPYARRLPDWIELARAKGHEVLLTLSMPPLGHAGADSGPMAILSSADPKENLERLDWALDRAAGFVGVLDIVGDRTPAETAPILSRLAQHGVMLVSDAPVPGERPALPLATGIVTFTPDMSRREIEQKIAAVEAAARRDGHALAIGIVGPGLLRQVTAWLATLPGKSIALAPATAAIAAPPNVGIARMTAP